MQVIQCLVRRVQIWRGIPPHMWWDTSNIVLVRLQLVFSKPWKVWISPLNLWYEVMTELIYSSRPIVDQLVLRMELCCMPAVLGSLITTLFAYTWSPKCDAIYFRAYHSRHTVHEQAPVIFTLLLPWIFAYSVPLMQTTCTEESDETAATELKQGYH